MHNSASAIILEDRHYSERLSSLFTRLRNLRNNKKFYFFVLKIKKFILSTPLSVVVLLLSYWRRLLFNFNASSASFLSLLIVDLLLQLLSIANHWWLFRICCSISVIFSTFFLNSLISAASVRTRTELRCHRESCRGLPPESSENPLCGSESLLITTFLITSLITHHELREHVLIRQSHSLNSEKGIRMIAFSQRSLMSFIWKNVATCRSPTTLWPETYIISC